MSRTPPTPRREPPLSWFTAPNLWPLGLAVLHREPGGNLGCLTATVCRRAGRGLEGWIRGCGCSARRRRWGSCCFWPLWCICSAWLASWRARGRRPGSRMRTTPLSTRTEWCSAFRASRTRPASRSRCSCLRAPSPARAPTRCRRGHPRHARMPGVECARGASRARSHCRRRRPGRYNEEERLTKMIEETIKCGALPLAPEPLPSAPWRARGFTPMHRPRCQVRGRLTVTERLRDHRGGRWQR